MTSWKAYLLSVLISSLICSILSQMVSDTKWKSLMQLLCGVVIAISILAPLTDFNLENLPKLPADCRIEADVYISEGIKVASSEQEKIIKAYCESYILDKAKSLGSEVSVQIRLDKTMVPAFAELRCDDKTLQKPLQEILTMDLGIPKENQKWIWNQESNSS